MRRRYGKSNNIIKRKTKIRVNQTCSACLNIIIKGLEVWLISGGHGLNRRYYHIECGDKVDGC